MSRVTAHGGDSGNGPCSPPDFAPCPFPSVAFVLYPSAEINCSHDYHYILGLVTTSPSLEEWGDLMEDPDTETKKINLKVQMQLEMKLLCGRHPWAAPAEGQRDDH